MDSSKKRGKIIQIAHSKGGATKTTLCEGLSVELTRLGKRVVLIDGDHKQKSLSKWAARRQEAIEDEGKPWSNISCFSKKGRIRTDVLDMARDYDYVIIDTRGSQSAELMSGLLCADLVWVPIQTTQKDMEALEELAQHLMDTEELNPTRKVYSMLVRTSANPNSKSKKKGMDLQEKWGSLLTPARSRTTNREGHALPTEEGASVIEGKDYVAKGEIQNMVKEMLSYVQ